MFDPSKAVREPEGKWDSDERLPHNMGYKEAAHAVARRITYTKRATRFAIAAGAFIVGCVLTRFDQALAAAVAAALVVLTAAAAISASVWAKRAKLHLYRANEAIKIIEPKSKEMELAEPVTT